MTSSSLGPDTVGLQGNFRAIELHHSRHRGPLQRGQDATRKLRSQKIQETQAMENMTQAFHVADSKLQLLDEVLSHIRAGIHSEDDAMAGNNETGIEGEVDGGD